MCSLSHNIGGSCLAAPLTERWWAEINRWRFSSGSELVRRQGQRGSSLLAGRDIIISEPSVVEVLGEALARLGSDSRLLGLGDPGGCQLVGVGSGGLGLSGVHLSVVGVVLVVADEGQAFEELLWCTHDVREEVVHEDFFLRAATTSTSSSGLVSSRAISELGGS